MDERASGAAELIVSPESRFIEVRPIKQYKRPRALKFYTKRSTCVFSEHCTHLHVTKPRSVTHRDLQPINLVGFSFVHDRLLFELKQVILLLQNYFNKNYTLTLNCTKSYK